MKDFKLNQRTKLHIQRFIDLVQQKMPPPRHLPATETGPVARHLMSKLLPSAGQQLKEIEQALKRETQKMMQARDVLLTPSTMANVRRAIDRLEKLQSTIPSRIVPRTKVS